MGLQSKKWWKSTSILINIMYIISVITPSPFYYRTHLFTHPSLPRSLPIQAVNAISIFVFLQGKGWMPTAECQMATAIFILWLVLPPVSIINLVHTCLRTHHAKRGGRQLWVKTSVPWLIFLTRQLQRGRDQTLWKRGPTDQ